MNGNHPLGSEGSVLVQFFSVVINKDSMTIKIKNKNVRVNRMAIFIDQYYVGSISLIDTIVLNTSGYHPNTVQIQAEVIVNGQLDKLNETHLVKPQSFREPQNKAGDILIACDNVNGLPYGYMGHGAMAINDTLAIESLPFDPIVRIITIESFKKDHPIHAQFRPVSEEMGQNAAKYALYYLDVYQKNKKKGINKPTFYFTLKTPLKDEWTYIYCTKLIWLSYYYGAGYEFKNDHLWFSPEDVYSNCIDNPDFKVIYIHPNFTFHLDL
ncbi:hypothetical protein [Bacillus sp. T3]|uniref:hypothetical protein n=1 Tax=Bacillus sp. T3 TaxID=467262 RepID=UPI002982A044|nr:hypothetical protein [Bacillus sp. T3]